MKLKLSFILLLFHLFQYSVKAQQISGKVVDCNDKSIDLVTVLLYETNDSTFITGTITGQDGRFFFNSIDKDNLYIKLSCTGYQDAITPLLLEETNYVLQESSIMLNDYNQVINNDTRMVSVSVKYNLGEYKDKKKKETDTLRFGI